jgi:2-keto-4-pentenoate hydratase
MGTQALDPVQVERLYTARRESQTGLDLSDHGLSRKDGLEIQLAVLEKFVASGDSLAGWKVSYTSGSARDKMGTEYRPFGYVLGSRLFDSGATVRLAEFANAQIEAELGLRLGKPLTGPVSAHEARSAVAEVVPCFELNEIRYSRESDHATILADGCGQWGVVVGPAGEMSDNLSNTAVSLWNDGVLRATSPDGLAMDDPFLSLSRLSAMLSEFGRSVEVGQVVITGSFVKAKVNDSGKWRADFDGIGTVEVSFG